VLNSNQYEDADEGGWDFGTVREPGNHGHPNMYAGEDVSSAESFSRTLRTLFLSLWMADHPDKELMDMSDDVPLNTNMTRSRGSATRDTIP
jgi:hypothetical protein